MLDYSAHIDSYLAYIYTTMVRGPQREEMVYKILNIYGFTQDSGIHWMLIS